MYIHKIACIQHKDSPDWYERLEDARYRDL